MCRPDLLRCPMVISLMFSLILFLLLYGRISLYILMPGAIMLFLILCYFRKKHRHTHGAFLSIDSYAQKSPLNQWSPGLKICFCMICSLLCIAANSLWVSLFVTATMALITILKGKIPIHYYLSLMSVPAVFILLGTAAMLIEISAEPIGILNIPAGAFYISVTGKGQLSSFLLICRAFGAVSCLYLLSLTTPMHRIIAALGKVKVPGLVIELMYLIYRYLFVLLDSQHQMQTAAASRLGDMGIKTSIRTLCSTSMNLLFISFRRSPDCFAAMESRCYDGKIAFLENKNRITPAEFLFMAGYLCLLISLWIIVWRFGL